MRLMDIENENLRRQLFGQEKTVKKKLHSGHARLLTGEESLAALARYDWEKALKAVLTDDSTKLLFKERSAAIDQYYKDLAKAEADAEKARKKALEAEEKARKEAEQLARKEAEQRMKKAQQAEKKRMKEVEDAARKKAKQEEALARKKTKQDEAAAQKKAKQDEAAAQKRANQVGLAAPKDKDDTEAPRRQGKPVPRPRKKPEVVVPPVDAVPQRVTRSSARCTP